MEVLANPIYAGIGPFTALVTDETWIKAFQKLMLDIGANEALTLMLKELRKSFPQFS